MKEYIKPYKPLRKSNIIHFAKMPPATEVFRSLRYDNSYRST